VYNSDVSTVSRLRDERVGRARQLSRRAVPTFVAALIAIGGLTACTASRPASTARHLVLVTIDTLRADRVGVYGGGDLTPHLDRIAREGAYAVDAMSHVPLTRPSHATLLSGRLPWQLGVRDNLAPIELPPSPLLAEVLKGAGFHTAAFVSSMVLDRRGGFDRGFDRYDDEFPKTQDADLLSTLQKPGADSLHAAIAWLESQSAGDRLFLWLHLFEPHDPYEPPEPYATRYRDRPYDGEVAYADTLVGELDDALERLGLEPDTLVVVAADHGEGLGEHHETLHGFFVYQTTLAVPLIFRGPGVRAGGRVTGSIGLVDVLPTAIDLLGLELPPNAVPAGASLGDALRAGRGGSETAHYAESLVPLLHFGWSDLRVLRQGPWKYVLAPRPELYDLANDPHELTNLAGEDPGRAETFRKALTNVLEQERRISTGVQARTIPVGLLEQLGALGYVSGVSDPSTIKASGADPKDKILEFRRANQAMRDGLVALNRRQYADAADQFGALIGSGIESFEAHLYLARALAGMKRFDRAAPHFEQAAHRAPLVEEAWTGWAESRMAIAGPDAALAIVREGRNHNPGGAQLALAEATLCLRLRRPGEAVAAYQAAAALLPRSATVRQQLGELQRDLGQIEPALATLRDAVAVDATNASAWNALGMTLGGSGRLDEAEHAFRQAVELNGNDHRYHFNLGLVLVRQGRGGLARPSFERALQLRPDFVPARDELRKLEFDRGGRHEDGL
jgi:arylsulfatase A-like enzyme/tetratricopeptide (TPR) repeat protein